MFKELKERELTVWCTQQLREQSFLRVWCGVNAQLEAALLCRSVQSSLSVIAGHLLSVGGL